MMYQNGCGIFKNIIWLVQRATRGYADCDVWSVDGYLNDLLPKLIRGLKGGVGCPCDLYDKTRENNECWKWEEILESMAQGFEAVKAIGELKYMKHTDNGLTVDEDCRKNLIAKYNKGMNLFHKYYMNLWD